MAGRVRKWLGFVCCLCLLLISAATTGGREQDEGPRSGAKAERAPEAETAPERPPTPEAAEGLEASLPEVTPALRKVFRNSESLTEADRLGANLRRWEARRNVELADLREKLEALSAQYRKEEAEQ